MPQKPWRIAAIRWPSAGARPTHITITLGDPALLPALARFAASEGLRLLPAALPRENQYWLAYGREDFKEAQWRLDEHITEAYYELKAHANDAFQVDDQVRLVERGGSIWDTRFKGAKKYTGTTKRKRRPTPP